MKTGRGQTASGAKSRKVGWVRGISFGKGDVYNIMIVDRSILDVFLHEVPSTLQLLIV